ncbi:MAG: TnpV protein [Clostridia bacterium]|nr:TnpV protein [Clostridia bacterium]
MHKLNYTRCGDYYISDIRLPEETRSIGRWGRMHGDYIKENTQAVRSTSRPTPIPSGTRSREKLP